MPRVKGGPRAHAKHKKVLKLAKGYRGTRSTNFKRAQEAVLRAGKHAFQGRRQRRRDARTLWVSRISSALSNYDISYSRFINALKKANIKLNRKTLSEMAIHDTASFESIVQKAKSVLA